MSAFFDFFRKFTAKIILSVLFVLAFPALVFAQLTEPPITAPSNFTNINQLANANGTICVFVNWIFWLVIVLAIIYTLLAAFRYLFAAGDPEKVKLAGATLLYVVVAIIVALVAKGLPLIISSFIGGGLTSVGC